GGTVRVLEGSRARVAARGEPVARSRPGGRTLLSEELAGRPGTVRRVPDGPGPTRDRLRCRRPHRERDAGARPPPRARHAGAPPRPPRVRAPADGIGQTERRASLPRVAPRGRRGRTTRREGGRGWSP